MLKSQTMQKQHRQDKHNNQLKGSGVQSRRLTLPELPDEWQVNRRPAEWSSHKPASCIIRPDDDTKVGRQPTRVGAIVVEQRPMVEATDAPYCV